MIESIEKHQPHIVVDLGDSVHVLSLKLIRDIANGRKENVSLELSRCIAVALMDYLKVVK